MTTESGRLVDYDKVWMYGFPTSLRNELIDWEASIHSDDPLYDRGITLTKRRKTCPDCGMRGRNTCHNCGCIIEIHDTTDYNVYGECSGATGNLRIAGHVEDKKRYSQLNVRLLASTNVVAYTDRSNKVIYNRIHSWVYQSNIGLPKSAIDDCIAEYHTIRENDPKRGTSLNAILIAILYIQCRNKGTHRSLRYFSRISGIHITAINRGMNYYMSLGKTQPKSNTTYTATYAISEKLGIDLDAEWIERFLQATSPERLPSADNIFSEQCRLAGIVAVITQKKKLKKPLHEIASACDISKTAFMRFVTMVRTWGSAKRSPEIAELLEELAL